MEPNEKYWNPARKPSVRIVFDNIISKSDAIKSIESGDGKVDILSMLTPADAKAFHGGKKAKIVEDHAKTVLVGVFNQNKDGSPWRDIKVRKALNTAIDRKAIVAKGAGGYGLVIPALIQPGRYGAVPGLRPYPLDLAKAGPILKAAKFKDDTIVIAASKDYEPVVDEIAAELSKVGLKVKGNYDADPGKDWDVKLTWHFDWSPEYPVGVVHREFFGKDGGYRVMPEDAKFDALYQKVLATTDKSKQEKVVQEVEKYEYDQANVLFLYSPSTLFAVSNRVSFTPYDTFMMELAETKVKSPGN